MKLLTTNFLTCAVKACKTTSTSFPLHFRDAVLERTEIDFNPLFMRNILTRVNWEALTTTAGELGLSSLVPERNPTETISDESVAEETTAMEDVEGGGKRPSQEDEKTKKEEQQEQPEISEEVLRKLHNLLLETGVVEGKLVCANCGFEYPIKEGVGNFLLPAHLV